VLFPPLLPHILSGLAGGGGGPRQGAGSTGQSPIAGV